MKNDMNTALTELEGVGWREQVNAAREAGIIPRNMTDDAALGIGVMARELGIPIVSALRQVHVIKGKPTLSAQMMLALAYRRLSGFDMVILKSTADVCEMKMRRAADKEWSALAYTFKQAQQAGVAGNENWKRHPDDMLRNRVASKLLKMIAPDVFGGLYTADEMEEVEIPHQTRAQEVQARIVGTELPEAAPVEPDDPVGEEPHLALDEWTLALEQAGERDEWARHCLAIKADARLTDADRDILRQTAEAKRDRMGWKH